MNKIGVILKINIKSAILIMNNFGAKNYTLLTDGTNVCRDLGIQKIREHCQHFDSWITTIIKRSEEILANKIPN